jgi:hypothetical protein
MTSYWRQFSAPGFGERSEAGFGSSDFRLRRLLCGMVAGLALNPYAVRACAACYGKSDSPMAQGMNWGIFSLLAVIVAVLGGVAAFFVFLGRRSAALAAGAATGRGAPAVATAGLAVAQGRSAAFGLPEMKRRWRPPHKCGNAQAAVGCAPERFVESSDPLV